MTICGESSQIPTFPAGRLVIVVSAESGFRGHSTVAVKGA